MMIRLTSSAKSLSKALSSPRLALTLLAAIIFYAQSNIVDAAASTTTTTAAVSTTTTTTATVAAATTTNVVVSVKNTGKFTDNLSSVIDDLHTAKSVAPACLLTSRSVTKNERSALLKQIALTSTSATAPVTVLSSNDESTLNKSTLQSIVGLSNGLVLAMPASVSEVTTATLACQGTILYLPSRVDLSRGEGLFDTLAPAMESLLSTTLSNNSDTNKPVLIVVVTNGDTEKTRNMLEQAAANVLPNLVSPKPVALLDDVFAKVLYVQPSEIASTLLTFASPIIDAKATIKQVALAQEVQQKDLGSTSSTLSMSGNLSPTDLAAARKLGPAARTQLALAIEQIQQQTRRSSSDSKTSSDADSTSSQQQVLVTEFGRLCQAVINQADDALKNQAIPSVVNSNLGQQIRNSMRTQLYAELGQVYDKQVDLLQQAQFEAFRKGLSKLLISPNLASDMDKVANQAISSFNKAIKKLVVNGAAWPTQGAKEAFRRRVKEHCKNRLLTAQASGQYKPLPRKGVTVGLHWLLPKPFGNDYRQEPWMVHATDNMVYIPPDKLTDVNPEDVKAGDWRTKIVPSPVGNDMIYMQ